VARAQEVLVEADASQHPPDSATRKVHGDIRFGAGFGFITEDPIASLAPSFGLDLRDVAPVQFRLGAPINLRIYDRTPEQGPVIRKTEWDEVGDYLAILQQLSLQRRLHLRHVGRAMVDVRVGNLQRVHVGHGTIVHGFANSLDVDRRRTGLDALARVEGDLLDQPAGSEVQLVVSGPRGAADFWHAARRRLGRRGRRVLGVRRSVRAAGAQPVAGRRARDRQAQPAGRDRDRGVAVVGFDISYSWSDRWRYLVVPYFDMNFMPGLGRGMHLGVDTEFHARPSPGVPPRCARRADRRQPAATTRPSSTCSTGRSACRRSSPRVTSTSARRSTPTRAQVRVRAGRTTCTAPAAYGGLRLAHDEGFFFETGYRYRPGPLGHTWENRLGLDLEVVQMSLLLAHKGGLGFNIAEPSPNGTLARLDLAVPVHRFIDVTVQGGWQPVMRRAVNETAAHGVPSAGFYGAGALFLFGAAGHFDW
jgi:hypothetical protein